MSNVHIKLIEDKIGDLVDMEYYHHSCSPEDVLGWPAPESVDYSVYCEKCKERIWEVPLTERQYSEYPESANDDGAEVAWPEDYVPNHTKETN